MDQMTLNLSAEINSLHDELCGLARTSLEKAIEIGGLLARQKAELKHGQWLPWCRDNLEFSQATVTKYLAIFRNREKLLATSNLGIEEAYRLLSQPADEPEEMEFDLMKDGEPEESTPPPQTSLETSDQKAAALDLAEELAQEDGTPVTTRHIERAKEAVAAVPIADGDSVVKTAEKVKEEAKQHVHVAQNSGENEWYTPLEFIESAKIVMGEIDLDPASSEIANATVKAARIYTKEENGLQKPWAGKIWMNPPYAQPLIQQFADRLDSAVQRGEVSEAIVLVNNATETKWFQTMAHTAKAVCFPKSRIRFLDPEGNPGAPLQGQAILYFGEHSDLFSEEFSKYGITFS